MKTYNIRIENDPRGRTSETKPAIDPALSLPAHWPLVRLQARSKKAANAGLLTPVRSHALAKRYLERGANLGLLCGEMSGIAVIDIDRPDLYATMTATLGPLPIRFVTSGGGDDRGHYYVRWLAHLPARLIWEGETIGEILRERQYAVIPPSVHPETGRAYRWCVTPTMPVPSLPEPWLRYFDSLDGPRVRPAASGDLPSGDIERRQVIARGQPGASRRPDGRIKFQCPVCRDSHQDNAVLFPAGTYGCSQDDSARTHYAALRELFGPSPRTRQAGRLRAQVDGLIAELAHAPLPGRSGTTDTAVLLAHLAIIRRLGRWDHGASEREVADAVGIKQATVHVSHHRLMRAGRLIRLERATSSCSTRWQVIPTGYRPSTDQPRKVSAGDQSLPKKGERNDPIRKPFYPGATILAHDAFRNRTGLGKGCGLAYVRLTTAPEDGLGLTEFGASKATTWKRLRTLLAFNLARHDPATRRWRCGPAALDRVAKRLRSYGQGARQRLRHETERALRQQPDRVRPFPRRRGGK
jgi:hypothetical protein